VQKITTNKRKRKTKNLKMESCTIGQVKNVGQLSSANSLQSAIEMDFIVWHVIGFCVVFMEFNDVMTSNKGANCKSCNLQYTTARFWFMFNLFLTLTMDGNLSWKQP